MKKSDLKGWMIVETGYDNEKYIFMAGKLINSKMEGYELEDFTEDLVHKHFKPVSISKVYEPVKLNIPFELNIGKILSEQKPKIIWERKPTKLSKKLLSEMDKKQMENYMEEITYPVIIVE